MPHSMAVIGPVDLIKPFRAVGATVFEVNNPHEAGLALNQATTLPNIGIIMLSEIFAEALSVEIERLKRQALPALFIVPEYKSKIHAGRKRLQQVMARATGKMG